MKRSILFLLILSSISAIAEIQPLEFSQRNIINFGLRNSQKLVLTFDDGPVGSIERGTTKSILDSLKLYSDRGYKVPSAFFVLGNLVNGRTALLQRMSDEGHIVANHTTFHPNLTRGPFQNSQALFQELLGAHVLITTFMPAENDVSKRWYFRAPGGNWSGRLATELNQHPVLRNYIGPLFWNIGGELKTGSDGLPSQAADWACWSRGLSAKACAVGYLRETERQQGGVVLFHDINMKTAEMLKYLLVAWTNVNLFNNSEYDYLKNNFRSSQYEFISLDEVEALDAFDRRANY